MKVKENAVEYVLALESLIKIIRNTGDVGEEYGNMVVLLVSLGFDIEEIDKNLSKIELLQQICKGFSEIELFEDE